MRMHLAVLAAVAAVSAAACGGGTAHAKDDFIAAADVICARANDKIGRRPLAADTLGIDGPAAHRRVVSYYVNFVRVERVALGELRGEPAPSGGDASVKRFLAAFEQMIRYAEASLAALRAGDLEGFRSSARIRKLYRLSAQVELSAAAYGFEDCTQLGIR